MSNGKGASTRPDGYRTLSCSELQALLQNEEKMDHIIGLNEKFQEMQVARETLLANNRSLAEESLARRPRLHHGKLRLADMYKELSALTASCWEKHSRLESHLQKRSLDTVRNLLQDEVARAELKSEELLENFMQGSLPLDDFLDSFLSCRRSYHVRRAQAEKIREVGVAKAKTPVAKEEEERGEKEGNSDEPRRPAVSNGPTGQGPPRVFHLRYGLTPAILLPHPSAPAGPPHHSVAPPTTIAGHAHPVGLRVIGQLQGGWPVGGRPVRLQQLYRPPPQQPEPPYR